MQKVLLAEGPYKGKSVQDVPLDYLWELVDGITDDYNLLLAVADEIHFRKESSIKRRKRRSKDAHTDETGK